jgi:hypothetical protein
MTEPTYRRAVIIGLLVMTLPLANSIVAYARGSRTTPFLTPPKANTRCIFDAPTMRYHHMTYLKTERDRVVREGKRLEHAGLPVIETCGNCHGAKAGFCDQCHHRAGVQLDCFGCHRY